jgi:hypothetical protein
MSGSLILLHFLKADNVFIEAVGFDEESVRRKNPEFWLIKFW